MGDEPPVASDPGPRYAAVLLFVAAWMACGWLLRLDTNLYLVLGIPLAVLFQWLVRRQPVRALWVREAPPFRLGWKGIAVGVALSVVPVASFAGSVVERQWANCLYALCAVAGAFGAAYGVQNFRAEHLRLLAWCLLITLALDVVTWSLFLGLGLVEVGPAGRGIAGRVMVGLISFLLFVPAVFVMEEVTFRMLDSHLHELDRRRGIFSAVFVSVAWSLWHLPIADELSWQVVGILLYVHVPYGVCLSLFWRRSGNLIVPGLCHALGDAVRDAIIAPG